MSDLVDDIIIPPATGAVGTNVTTFQVDGITYQVTGTSNDGGALSLLDVKALITSGQAAPVAANYLAQFPWTTPPA